MGGWYKSWTGLWTGRTRCCEFGSTKLGAQVLRCSYVTLCKTEFTLLAMHRASLASKSRAFAQTTAVIHDPPFFILPPSSTVKQGRRHFRRDFNFICAVLAGMFPVLCSCVWFASCPIRTTFSIHGLSMYNLIDFKCKADLRTMAMHMHIVFLKICCPASYGHACGGVST